VRIHPQERKATNLRKWSVLTSGRVADGVVPISFGEDEEAITRGSWIEPWDVKTGDGLETVGGSVPSTVVEGDDLYAAASEQGEVGLTGVMGDKEVAVGGGATPGGADGAAADDGFWGQAD
jgi:hypothetical protein